MPDSTEARQPSAGVKRSSPTMARLAGHRWFPLWAVVRHVGRTTGTRYAIPVAVMATPDTFVIGLPWGPTTNWVRNIQAAGAARMRWRGREYVVDRPRLVGRDVALAAAGPVTRRGIERAGLEDFLELRRRELATPRRMS